MAGGTQHQPATWTAKVTQNADRSERLLTTFGWPPIGRLKK